MVDILLIISLTITVLYTVDLDIKRKREIKSLNNRLKNIDDTVIKSQLDITGVLTDLTRETKQNKKDIEAIANAINVYSNSIAGTVEDKVKANVDLFSEWLNGEEE